MSYAPPLPGYEQTIQLEINIFPSWATEWSAFDQRRTCVQQKQLQRQLPWMHDLIICILQAISCLSAPAYHIFLTVNNFTIAKRNSSIKGNGHDSPHPFWTIKIKMSPLAESLGLRLLPTKSTTNLVFILYQMILVPIGMTQSTFKDYPTGSSFLIQSS